MAHQPPFFSPTARLGGSAYDFLWARGDEDMQMEERGHGVRQRFALEL
jgi:hypothetical protein